MLKNKLAISILLLCITFNDYSMEESEEEDNECIELEKKELSPENIEETRRQIFEAIALAEPEGLREILEKFKEKAISAQIKDLLRTPDPKTRKTAAELAKTIPDRKRKRITIEILEQHDGLPTRLMSDQEFEIKLKDIQNIHLRYLEKLIKAISAESEVEVKKQLEEAYIDLVKFNNKLYFTIVLTEFDPVTGHTLLTLATDKDRLNIVNMLINAGANPRQKNKNGHSAEDIAKHKDPINQQLLDIFSKVKKTAREISDEFTGSPEYLKMVEDAEREKAEAPKRKISHEIKNELMKEIALEMLKEIAEETLTELLFELEQTAEAEKFH